MNSVAIDPRDDRNIYAAGNSIVKSTDGGGTWAEASQSGVPSTPNGIYVDRTLSRRVWLTTTAGLYWSADGGENWQPAALPQNLEFDKFAQNPAGIILVGSNQRPGLYRSVDDGASWQSVANGLPFFTGVFAIAFDSSLSSRAFLSGGGYLFVSSDGGADWSVSPGPSGLSIGASGGTIAVAVNGVQFSHDHGKTWQNRSKGIPAAFRNIGVVAMDPAGASHVIAGSEAGIFETTDAGESWTQNSHGFHGGSWVCSVVCDPDDPEIVLAGTIAESVLSSSDGGITWTPLRKRPQAAYFNALAFKPRIPKLAIGGNNGVFRSFNDGSSWSALTLPGKGRFSVFSIAASSDIVYATAFPGSILTSTDAGSTWRPGQVSADRNLSQPSTFTSVAIDAGNDSIAYASFAGGNLYRTDNRGLSWKRLQSFGNEIGSIYADPVIGGSVYAAIYDSILRSTDYGVTWSSLGGLPGGGGVTSLCIPRDHPGMMFAAMFFGGVFKSDDSGQSWSAVADELGPLPNVTALSCDASAHRLYAGTSGFGVFSIDPIGVPALPKEVPIAPVGGR